MMGIRGKAMNLTLSDDEARILGDLLRDHLHDLKLEMAHTDSKAFRHLLVQRANLCERLVEELPREVPAT